jgi:5-methylcytosine-specific restriction endonuclease McrA
MRYTPSQITNLMRRGLRLLVDPEPEAAEKQKCIAFFEHCCAYCSIKMEKGQGDLDHLLSASLGGRNHISNRVFSCKPCNAKEKRDKPWEEFLVEKHGKGAVAARHRKKILAWVNQAGHVPPLPDDVLHVLKEESRKVTAQYMQACTRVRGVQQALPSDRRRQTGC